MLNLFLGGLAMMAVLFAVVWAISVKVRNYGFLDVAWSYGIAILAPFYALNSPGSSVTKWLMTAIGVLWSVRLGTYILCRVLRHHPSEDIRYEGLRNRWKGPGMFLLFFELQALIIALFSFPFLAVCFRTETAPILVQVIEQIGLGLAFIALCGEALSDWQMQRFKKTAPNKNAVCQVGLWRYSRHPNYFFESLVWWGFFLAALGSPHGWPSILAPLLMLYFLFRVTGIPLTEEFALKTKGAAYKEYQQTTSAFVPWFRKNSSL